jgi:hypothetical protein
MLCASDDDFDDDEVLSQTQAKSPPIAMGGLAGRDRAASANIPGGAPPSDAGILQRLLALFGRRTKAKTPPSAAPDRTPFRPRVEAMLEQLRAPANNAMARRTQLQTLLPALEALFQNLVAAGDRHESVERLGKLLVSLRTLLPEAAPSESALEQHHLQLVIALQNWLALDGHGTAPLPVRRDGFWK